MYKNQLQELAQRSCFSLPSYTCIREGPDHAPRFKAIVNFNGDSFESPQYYSTLRQAEHAAAEVALNALSSHGPSHSLAARILDETGVYKNLLQEIAQRVGSPLPQYTTFRSGLGHQPIFTGTVELAGITFTGEHAKNKKQAEKNAALAAWLSLKQLAQQEGSSSSEQENNDEQEQIKIARALLNYRLKGKLNMVNSSNSSIPFQKKFSAPTPRPASPKKLAATTSKILPLLFQKAAPRNRPPTTIANDSSIQLSQPPPPSQPSASDQSCAVHSQIFPAAGATPYVPIRQHRTPYSGIAPPVSVRTAIPVYSAPQLLPPARYQRPIQPRPLQVAPSVCIRQAVPVFAAPPSQKEDQPTVGQANLFDKLQPKKDDTGSGSSNHAQQSEAVKCLEQLKI